jgi:hypothetical protein
MEIELRVRTSWKGLTIKDYFAYLEALENPNTSDFEKQLDILAILCQIKRADLMDLPANQIVPLFDKMEFMKVPPKEEVRNYYDINGRKFKLCMNVGEITAGQFIDLNNYTKDPEFIMDNLHMICAILMAPVIPYRGKSFQSKIRVEKYNPATLNERAEFLFEHMPIGEAVGISSFFTFLFSLFIEITKRYLEQMKTTQLNLASKTLSRKEINRLKSAQDGSKKNGIGSQP